MSSSKRCLRMVVVLALASSAVLVSPVAARAEYCSSRIYIYSHTGIQGTPRNVVTDYGTGPPDQNNLLCYDVGHWLGYTLSVGPGRKYDTRVITPGANMIMVRVLQSYAPGSLTLSGLINRRNIKMSRTRSLVPGTLNDLYDSPWIPIDPRAKGSLTATIGRDSNTYHTID